MQPWQSFLVLTASCLFVQGLFAMLEMACVSFNKVRLQYYVSKKYKRAVWLSYLLNHPALLFGTTLIMVNAALLIGSESSRKFYDSIGINPDWAPLTQIFLVLIFAEICPMFAGRHYAEHAAKIGVPILYACAMLLRPFIWLLDIVCKAITRLLGQVAQAGMYLTREELQAMIEEREESFSSNESSDFNTVVSNIFTLKNKSARELMDPIEPNKIIPSTSTVAELRSLLSKQYMPYIPIYHRNYQNIVAIAFPRDLLRLSDNRKVRENARSPWFITETSSVIQILKQFRRNNQSIAIVLNDAGLAVGILTLDAIIDTVFGRDDLWNSFGDIVPRAHQIVVDRTFPGDMQISEFNKRFHVHLGYKDAKTLSEAVQLVLGHPPTKGESVRIDQFELTVEEASLLEAKLVAVRTVY